MIYKRYTEIEKKGYLIEMGGTLLLFIIMILICIFFDKLDLPIFFWFVDVFHVFFFPVYFFRLRKKLYEEFYIDGDTIIIKEKDSERKIVLPDEMIVIFVTPMELKRNVDYSERMEELFSMCLIEETDLSTVIRIIDKKFYYAGWIEKALKNKGFLYTCCYKPEILKAITNNRKCILVDPEFYKEKMNIDYSCFSGIVWDKFLSTELINYKKMTPREAIKFYGAKISSLVKAMKNSDSPKPPVKK